MPSKNIATFAPEVLENTSQSVQDGLEALFEATPRQLRSYYDDLQSRAAKPALQRLTDIFGITQLARSSGVLAQLVVQAEAEQTTQRSSGKEETVISFEVFEACATSMKVGALLSLHGEGGGILSVSYYSPRQHEQIENVEPSERPRWLMEPWPEWASCRWLHLQAIDGVVDDAPQALRLVGMQLGLHPLSISDAIDDSDTRRAKCVPYGGHLLLTFPLVELARDFSGKSSTDHANSADAGGSNPKDSNGEPPAASSHLEPPLLRISTLSFFLVMPRYDVLVSFANADSMRHRQGPMSVFSKLQRHLKCAYSLPRSGDCRLLLYEILDAIIDHLDPALDALEERLAEVVQSIRTVRSHSPAHQARAYALQRDVKQLLMTVLPLPRVVKNLGEIAMRKKVDEPTSTQGYPSLPALSMLDFSGGGGANAHSSVSRENLEIMDRLRDLEDRLETDLFRLRLIEHDSKALDTELQRAIDTKTQRVLFALTVLSAIFVPANFLAAVEGMNFEYMPELQLKWGYGLFWGVLVLVWTVFGVLMKYVL